MRLNYIGFELTENYHSIAMKRTEQEIDRMMEENV